MLNSGDRGAKKVEPEPEPPVEEPKKHLRERPTSARPAKRVERRREPVEEQVEQHVNPNRKSRYFLINVRYVILELSKSVN